MKQSEIDVVRQLKDLYGVCGSYISKLPREFSGIIDNPYSDSQYQMIDVLIDVYFKEYAEEIRWFIWEFDVHRHTSGPHIVQPDGTAWTFNSNEDYYEYLTEI